MAQMLDPFLLDRQKTGIKYNRKLLLFQTEFSSYKLHTPLTS